MSKVNGVVFTPAAFATLNLLTTPLWILNRHRLQLLWANQAALPLWQAASLAELLQREFSAPSERLPGRWQTDWQQLHQGKPIVEAWLFHQEGHMTVVQCHLSAIKLEAGQEALLVEGKIGSLSRLNSEPSQGLEVRCISDPLTGKSVQLMLERETASTEPPVSGALHQRPLSDLDEACSGYTGFCSDITQYKQMEETLQSQAERQQLIGAFIQHVHQSLDLEDVLSKTVAEVRTLFQADRVLVHRPFPKPLKMASDNGIELVVTESVAAHYASILGKITRVTPWLESQFQHCQPGQVSGFDNIATAALDQPYMDFLLQLQVKAKLAVPLYQGDCLWGLLVIHHCKTPYSWQQTEIELLQQLAVQVSLAIQQAELYQQVQQFNAGLEQQVQEHTAQLQQALHFESTLKQITDRVRDSLDERLILQTVVQALAVALQVICCDIAIYNEARTTSTICYDYTDGSIPSAQGEVVQMAESYDPALHTQLLQGLCFQFCPLVLNQARPLKEPIAILSCPIVDDQGVLGDMWLSKPMHDLFNELEIRLIQQVTNQTAIAIRQARLYQAAQTQISELDRLNRLKDDFLSTVSHELRSPMANIKMATQMLGLVMTKVGLFEQEPSAKQYFRILQEECQRELSLINDLLDLARLDAEVEALRLTPVALELWLSHLVEPFTEKAQQQQQQLMLTLPSVLPLLTTDIPMLTRVLSELLTNACKYTRAGEQITVAAQLEPDALQISVANSGIEIPANELARIFDKFYRIPNHDPWKHGGTGLGLALVQKLVERLGATIAVTSTAGQTTFVVSLPLVA